MDLEKVLIREINNDSRIFLYKEEIAGVRTIIPHGIFAFYIRSSMRMIAFIRRMRLY